MKDICLLNLWQSQKERQGFPVYNLDITVLEYFQVFSPNIYVH
jgi:hypothetical protein